MFFADLASLSALNQGTRIYPTDNDHELPPEPGSDTVRARICKV